MSRSNVSNIQAELSIEIAAVNGPRPILNRDGKSIKPV